MTTKALLLDHAEMLARTRGFDAFSFADLSERVGIRKASIHYHFAAKATLAEALIKRYAERFAADLAALDDMQNGAHRLGTYLKLYRDALDGGRQICLCVAFGAARESFSADVLSKLTQFHNDNRAWLTDTFALGQADGSIRGVSEPAAEAAATLALVEGAHLLARAAQSTDPFDQATAALIARLR